MAFIVRAVRAGIDAHNDFKSAPTDADPELLREMRAPKRGFVYGPAYDLMMKFENSIAKGENKVTPFVEERSAQASGSGSGAASTMSSPTDENGGEPEGSATSSRSSSVSRRQRRRLPPPLPPPRDTPQRTQSGGSDTYGDGAGPSGSGSSRWRPLPAIPTLGRRSGRRLPPTLEPVPALADLMMNTALANVGSAGPSSSASPYVDAAGSELQGVGTGVSAAADAPDADDDAEQAPMLLRLARVPVLHQSTPDEPPERPSKDTAEDPPPPYQGHAEHYLLASAAANPTRRHDETTRTNSSPP